ncbi:unnamed protein product [Rotaria sordida]|uniref:SKI-interacting protein SKIP SNW domain-containing protein n=1 Tax=Rotaria sordida TaxID=392033 RepID=A0A815HWD9_9BILA|nr:unnamed protein product [Rotaria sordida]CAF3914343.1 unnamed protein product [Rotaria sordida]
MVEVQKDLIELPRFKINKKIPRGPPTADGRGLRSIQINENFAKLTESLYTADLKAHEIVDMRAKVEKQIVKKQKEERLRELALHARTGICPADKSDDQSAEHDQIRQERQKDRQHAAALQRARGDKRNRSKERDISKQIVLDVQTACSTSVQYDRRLFNMPADFGSSLGDDEAYNVYDQPWNSSATVVSQIYKPTKNNKR